ncbi:hypothetical protein J6590_041732 [Homalodisca vitripennis]|nr:hypothetical protein J6590_041732 [Homalodisca vitripennis]
MVTMDHDGSWIPRRHLSGMIENLLHPLFIVGKMKEDREKVTVLVRKDHLLKGERLPKTSVSRPPMTPPLAPMEDQACVSLASSRKPDEPGDIQGTRQGLQVTGKAVTCCP